jgi:predicted transcriptional regulator
MFKSKEYKEKEHERMVREILEEMVEEGLVYKDGNKYCITDLGLCEEEKLMRQGPIERMMWYIRMTIMDLEKDKRNRKKG